jgi:hypothetical protein
MVKNGCSINLITGVAIFPCWCHWHVQTNNSNKQL